MQTVDVKPEMIRWAIDRSGLPEELLLEKFPKLDEWQSGLKQPTLRQLEEFAEKNYDSVRCHVSGSTTGRRIAGARLSHD